MQYFFAFSFYRGTKVPKMMIEAMYTGVGILSNLVRLPDLLINSIRAFGDFEKYNINAAQIDVIDYEEESSPAKVINLFLSRVLNSPLQEMNFS